MATADADPVAGRLGEGHPRRAGAEALPGRPGRRHPAPPERRPRHVAPRHARPAAGRPGPGRRRRAHLRHPRRHQGAGRPRARPTASCCRPTPSCRASAPARSWPTSWARSRCPRGSSGAHPPGVGAPHRRRRRPRGGARLRDHRAVRGRRRARHPRRSPACCTCGRRGSGCGCPAACRPPGSTPATPPASSWAPPTSAPAARRCCACAIPVGGTRGALLHLAPLKPGESARAAYRLPTTRRGIIAVGPLGLEVGDPFGLAVQAAEAAPVLELTVLPPHRPHRRAGRRRRPRPARRGGQPERARPAGRRLLLPAGVRGRRRPAPGALAVDGPARRADGAPRRDALAGPHHGRPRRAPRLAQRRVAGAGGVGGGQRHHRVGARGAPHPVHGQRRRRLRPRLGHRPQRGHPRVPGPPRRRRPRLASARCSTPSAGPTRAASSSPCWAGPPRASSTRWPACAAPSGWWWPSSPSRRSPSRRPLQARLTRVDNAEARRDGSPIRRRR